MSQLHVIGPARKSYPGEIIKSNPEHPIVRHQDGPEGWKLSRASLYRLVDLFIVRKYLDLQGDLDHRGVYIQTEG